MPRWVRFVRGVIGTGLTFAAGVGVAASVIGGIGWLLHGISTHGLIELVAHTTFASFLLGVAFSGILALTARGRAFSKLSLPLVTTLGAGAGFAYWIFLRFNGGRTWTPRLAVGNFVLLIAMGAGSAAAMLLIARRARSALGPGDAMHELGAGDDEFVPTKRGSRTEARKL